jgi:hypothetical protein
LLFAVICFSKCLLFAVICFSKCNFTSPHIKYLRDDYFFLIQFQTSKSVAFVRVHQQALVSAPNSYI